MKFGALRDVPLFQICPLRAFCALTWQAAKTHTDVHSLPQPAQWDGGEIWEKKKKRKGKTCGLRYRQFNRAERKGEIIIVIMIKKYTKQVMHSATHGLMPIPFSSSNPLPNQFSHIYCSA